MLNVGRILLIKMYYRKPVPGMVIEGKLWDVGPFSCYHLQLTFCD